jgi:hypothetical protein
MTYKMLLSSSAWGTSVLGPQKVMPSIRHLPQRKGRQVSLMQEPLLKVAATTTTTTRPTAITSRWPSCQRKGKQMVYLEEDKDDEMEFQNAKMVLKFVYGYSNFESSADEHRKALHVMYGGPWDITS